MSNNLKLPEDKDLASKIIDNKKEETNLTLSIGLWGKIWGDEKHSSNNIAGFILVIIVIFGIGRSCFIAQDSMKDLWSIISPIITLICGYLFGNKHKTE